MEFLIVTVGVVTFTGMLSTHYSNLTKKNVDITNCEIVGELVLEINANDEFEKTYGHSSTGIASTYNNTESIPPVYKFKNVTIQEKTATSTILGSVVRALPRKIAYLYDGARHKAPR